MVVKSTPQATRFLVKLKKRRVLKIYLIKNLGCKQSYF